MQEEGHQDELAERRERAERHRALELGKTAAAAFAAGRASAKPDAQEANRRQVASAPPPNDTRDDLDLEPAERHWSFAAFWAVWLRWREANGIPAGPAPTRTQRRALEALLAGWLPSELKPSLAYFYAPDASANWPRNGFPLGVFLEVAALHLGRPAPPRPLCCACRAPFATDATYHPDPNGPNGRPICSACKSDWRWAFDEDLPALCEADPSLEELTRQERSEAVDARIHERQRQQLAHFTRWLQAQRGRAAANT